MPPFLAILLAMAVFASVGCDVGADAARAVRRAGDGIATRVVPDNTAGGQPTPTRVTVSSPDVLSVIEKLGELEIGERGSEIEYDRSDWRHWWDADRDCQDARAEALIEESLVAVAFATDEECRVTAGEWLGPWSGELFEDASDVDIDHHVPLGHAHVSGGWRWDAERKRAYANDLDNPPSLQVTGSSVNRSKGKKAPDEWRPDLEAGWCRYAADWIAVKGHWELTVTEGEVDALAEMVATCDDPGSWGLQGARPE